MYNNLLEYFRDIAKLFYTTVGKLSEVYYPTPKSHSKSRSDLQFAEEIFHAAIIKKQ